VPSGCQWRLQGGWRGRHSCQSAKTIGINFVGHGISCLRTHCPVVDADVVDKAGEEVSRLYVLADADVQAVARAHETILDIFCNYGAIDTHLPVQPVPYQAHTVPKQKKLHVAYLATITKSPMQVWAA
jgi:hypothetical protein